MLLYFFADPTRWGGFSLGEMVRSDLGQRRPLHHSEISGAGAFMQDADWRLPLGPQDGTPHGAASDPPRGCQRRRASMDVAGVREPLERRSGEW